MALEHGRRCDRECDSATMKQLDRMSPHRVIKLQCIASLSLVFSFAVAIWLINASKIEYFRLKRNKWEEVSTAIRGLATLMAQLWHELHISPRPYGVEHHDCNELR